MTGAPCQAFPVIPGEAVHPKTGGGQRSGVIFEAMRAICPVTVVILGGHREPGAEVFFPGAAAVRGIVVRSFMDVGEGRIAKQLRIGRRLLRPRSDMAVEPALRDELRELVRSEGRTVVVFRYFLTFARSGIVDDPAGGLRVVVDVDDRDDRKMAVQLRSRLGARLGALTARRLSPKVLDLVVARLRDAGLVWLAKEEDRFDGAAFAQAIVPNVPFPLDRGDDVGPAADGTSVLFVGSAGHMPNRQAVLWFLDRCWPVVRAACPAAECRVVGFGDWSEVSARHGATAGVTIVGAVESVAGEYRGARLAVCPIREGAGSQIKVIEACAFGRPVVATTIASRGFGPAIAEAIEKADDPGAFAAGCVRYLTDPDLATRTGRLLRDLQRRSYSREAASNQIALGLTRLDVSSPPS